MEMMYNKKSKNKKPAVTKKFNADLVKDKAMINNLIIVGIVLLIILQRKFQARKN